MKYYKRRWHESRGDDYDFWGKSDWYFSICSHSGITREQIEKYDDGTSLYYSEEGVMHDEFGGLSEVPFDMSEWASFEISKDEYELVKSKTEFKNAKSI